MNHQLPHDNNSIEFWTPTSMHDNNLNSLCNSIVETESGLNIGDFIARDSTHSKDKSNNNGKGYDMNHTNMSDGTKGTTIKKAITRVEGGGLERSLSASSLTLSAAVVSHSNNNSSSNGFNTTKSTNHNSSSSSWTNFNNSHSSIGSTAESIGCNSVVAVRNYRENSEMVPLAEGFIPSDNDVICGRGKKCYNHTGNERFRKIVESRLEVYGAATSRRDKSEILSGIVSEVRSISSGGGFVKNDPDTGMWYEVGDYLAREKTSQAFRDALHEQYRSSKKAKHEKRRQRDKEHRYQNGANGAIEEVSQAAIQQLTVELFYKSTSMALKRSSNKKRGNKKNNSNVHPGAAFGPKSFPQQHQKYGTTNIGSAVVIEPYRLDEVMAESDKPQPQTQEHTMYTEMDCEAIKHPPYSNMLTPLSLHPQQQQQSLPFLQPHVTPMPTSSRISFVAMGSFRPLSLQNWTGVLPSQMAAPTNNIVQRIPLTTASSAVETTNGGKIDPSSTGSGILARLSTYCNFGGEDDNPFEPIPLMEEDDSF